MKSTSFILFLLLIANVTFAQWILPWKNIRELNDSLPQSVHFYKWEGSLPNNRKAAVYIALINLHDKQLEVKSVAAANGLGLEKTSLLAQEHSALAAINGGYFSFRPDTTAKGITSVSLLVSDGKTIAYNAAQVNRRDSSGVQHRYYPTRSTFYTTKSGKAGIAWVYTHNENLYAYRKPRADTLPPPKREGKRLKTQQAMGGGPILVRNGKKLISDKEEFFTQIAGLHPRTAIGITPDKRLVFLVADGRQAHSEGLTFDDLAELMLGLGVKNAINLDGGGSSTLTAGTAIVNKPSDANGERKVASAVIARRREPRQNNFRVKRQ